MEIKAVDPEFVRVWSRVKGAPPREEAPEELPGEFIAGKLRAELERRRVYLSLGLSLPARESLLRANQLRTAWFFCSGESLWPSQLGAMPRYAGRREAIRQLYRSEALSEQDYLSARDGCGSEMLREVFARCAQGCRAARQALWDSIERSPGR